MSELGPANDNVPTPANDNVPASGGDKETGEANGTEQASTLPGDEASTTSREVTASTLESGSAGQLDQRAKNAAELPPPHPSSTTGLYEAHATWGAQGPRVESADGDRNEPEGGTNEANVQNAGEPVADVNQSESNVKETLHKANEVIAGAFAIALSTAAALNVPNVGSEVHAPPSSESPEQGTDRALRVRDNYRRAREGLTPTEDPKRSEQTPKDPTKS